MPVKRMQQLGEVRSVIREQFDYGMKRKQEIGEDKVFDFSIGNPSVPPPPEVTAELVRLLTEADPLSLHGYTPATGDRVVREAVAAQINAVHGTAFKAENLYMTVGAAASLSAVLSALVDREEEVVLLAPYFPEYTVFVQTAGGVPVVVPCCEADFQPDFDKLAASITEKTRAVIINSPNNPSGAVLSEDTLRKIAALLTEKSAAFGKTIYLISDEPYRELVYDGVTVPFVTPFYPATVVCYSYSKSLSLPGERIGYVLVPSEMPDFAAVYAAVCGAGRALGYVCAPSLFQKILPYCGTLTADRAVYARNRELLYNSLTAMGYTAVRPDGAFYLFVKAMEEDANAFCEKARKHELLLVPSDDFGIKGYVRIAYCVDTALIERALPAFEALAKEYQHG